VITVPYFHGTVVDKAYHPYLPGLSIMRWRNVPHEGEGSSNIATAVHISEVTQCAGVSLKNENVRKGEGQVTGIGRRKP
jgi:hypothetical protein